MGNTIGLAARATRILVGCAVLVVSACACRLPWDHSWVARLPVEDVDVSGHADGTYRGSFSYNRFTYVVDTTLRDGRYDAIVIVANRDTERACSAEAVTERVIESQSLHVDVVTGATNTSKALLKAIEDGVAR